MLMKIIANMQELVTSYPPASSQKAHSVEDTLLHLCHRHHRRILLLYHHYRHILPRQFTIPDTWRQIVMSAINAPAEAEKRKLLSANLWSAITRDLMTQCIRSCQSLTKMSVPTSLWSWYRNSFMRDVGMNVSGHVFFSQNAIVFV
jgi:hypothetical protein